MGIDPLLAAVKPRVLTDDGPPAPLELEIRALVEAKARGVVALLGPAGSGRTSALRHLAATIPPEYPLQLLDLPSRIEVEGCDGLVVYTALNPYNFGHLRIFRLAPWGRDDLIEYLLSRQKPQCASVMMRLAAKEREDAFTGLPALWSIVLDSMAAEPGCQMPEDALEGYFRRTVGTEEFKFACQACLGKVLMDPMVLGRTARLLRLERIPPVHLEVEDWGLLMQQALEERFRQLLGCQYVQVLLGAIRIFEDLQEAAISDQVLCRYFLFRFPQQLSQQVVRLIARSPNANLGLARMAKWGAPEHHATIASLSMAVRPQWRPESHGNPRHLAGAGLTGAQWAGLQMSGDDLREADLGYADLSGSILTQADLGRARMCSCRLSGAHLDHASAVEADFSGAVLRTARGDECNFCRANFQGADLEGVRFDRCRMSRADLSRARLIHAFLHSVDLTGAKVEGADFSHASLRKASLSRLDMRRAFWRGASFPEATLISCNLEGLELPGTSFAAAVLKHSLLTRSFMPGATFRRAKIVGCDLAGIHWERVDLRGADLSGSSFHRGTTRAGKVPSAIACEGSRTGFYTDEYREQHFQSPEAIRSANLRGADLRGANIDGVDFYLVDLRDAQYDAAQGEHLRLCGAILQARTPH